MSVVNSTEHVILKKDGRVATVVLNRPEVLNAMNEETFKEFSAKLDDLSASKEIDVVVICGNGKGFSAGGDIKSMLSSTDESMFGPVMDSISELIVKLYTLPKVVISAIHGPAAGIGFSVALASDYVWAHESSVLAMNFIGIGLIPDGAGHFFLEKRIGEVKAKHLIWEGKKLTAEEAKNLGLVDDVLTGDFQLTVNERVQAILNKPVKAMIQTKKVFNAINIEKLKTVLEQEKIGQAEMRKSQDHKEGVQAFLEKRIPKFTGK